MARDRVAGSGGRDVRWSYRTARLHAPPPVYTICAINKHIDYVGDAFRGHAVLITGHTGFKGSWLALWLHELGAHVTGYALAPPTVPNNFEAAGLFDVLDASHTADVRDADRLHAVIAETEPEVILHLAAQSVVRDGYERPTETFSVNLLGTTTLLDVVRETGIRCAIVVVTSDKCYANDESGRPFVEDDPLGGHDPYSASKAAAELAVAAYRASYFDPADLGRHGVAVATARAGNVIGGGDWTAHAVVPDIVRSITAEHPVTLRYPQAIRPWQHVLEPLGGYLLLARKLMGGDAARYCRSWNFGPERDDEAAVRELTETFLATWGAGTWVDRSRPDEIREAGVLRLSIDRARTELGWAPRWKLREAVARTVEWYRAYAVDPATARASCLADIRAYRGLE